MAVAAVTVARPCRNARWYETRYGTEKTKRVQLCKIECAICHGTGHVMTCPDCQGDGLVLGERCKRCGASGAVPFVEEIEEG